MRFLTSLAKAFAFGAGAVAGLFVVCEGAIALCDWMDPDDEPPLGIG